MKKISDKVVCIICTIAMCITCTLSYSWKIAHKTYADTVPTTKQELGMWFSSLLASMGARLYITTAQGYEWLVDNFNSVMDTLSTGVTLYDIILDAQDRYNQQDSTVVLSDNMSKAISEYLSTLVHNDGLTSSSTDVVVGTYETTAQGTYLTNWTFDFVYAKSGPGYDPKYQGYFVGIDNQNVRVVGVITNSDYAFYFLCNEAFKRSQQYKGSGTYPITPPTPNTPNTNALVYPNESGYYYYSIGASYRPAYDKYNEIIPVYDQISGMTMLETAFYYAYGLGANAGGIEEISVSADGTLSLDDMVDTLDRNKETEIDYTDFLGEDAGTKTLAEILALIQEAINSGVTDLVDAIPQAEVIIKTPIIIPENVDIPLLFQGLPEVVEPECVTLGGCLVSGVQTVSQHLQNVYSSHSAISNFTAVSLALGVAIYIITGGL